MKKLILSAAAGLLLFSCTDKPQTSTTGIRNGFYEVIHRSGDTAHYTETKHQLYAELDTLFNPGESGKVLIDTAEYVPLELEGEPSAKDQGDSKKLLSITLSKKAAEHMQHFSQKRVMKQVAIVIGGKVITMHKIREALTGPAIQITRCDDNACEYLYVKLKEEN